MQEKEKKKAPHEVLIEELVKAKTGRLVAGHPLPQWALRALGAQLLAETELNPKHKAKALAAIKEVREKEVVRDARAEMDEAIMVLEAEG